MSSKGIDADARLFRAPQRQPSAPFAVYVLLFHAAWIAWPYLVYPRLVSIGERTLTYAVINIGLRLLTWVVPVFAYLGYVDRVEPLGYLRLTRHVGRGLKIGLLVSALNVAGSIARFGLPHPSMARISWNSVLGTSFFVGFIEEIPYRGFMLQQIESRSRFWTANLLSSLLFVGVHLPGWIALHQLSADRVVTIFVFGVVMAVVFKYSGSLWAAIVAHSANDFLSFVLFGR